MDQAISIDTLTRRHRLRIAAAAALLASFCVAAWGLNRLVRPSVRAADITIAEVRRGDIANTINAAGTVIPIHEELVSSPIQSHIAKVHAKLGQQVKAGDLLLELDNRAVLLAIDSVKEQLAQQENRILALTLDMNQKRKALVSSIELLELDLQSAQAKLDRYRVLRETGSVSAQDLLAAEIAVKRAHVQLRQQKEDIDDNQRATQSNIAGARLQKAILQKQLDQQLKLLADTSVRAPFSGMLTALMTEEGASVVTGQQMAKVSALDNYRVEAAVSDFHARSVSEGQPALVEQGGQLLSGHVQSILPEIQNGTIRLLVALDRPNDPLLRNKMRVDVNIVTEQRKGTLVADAGPAFNGRGRQPVFVVHDGSASQRSVEIGVSDGKRVEILSGAKEGDRLITSNTAEFKDREHVRIAY